MELFDADCFVGRWPTARHQCLDLPGLREEMARLGISRALVRHTWSWWHDPKEGNEALLRQIYSEADLRPCLAATSLLGEEMGGLDSYLALLKQANAGAVCLFPRSHSYTLAPWSVGSLLDALQGIAMPLMLEMEETSWTEVQATLRDWPRLPVIVTRSGYRVLRNLLPLLRAHRNLYVDIAYLADNEALERIASSVGCERLLFGTGTPQVDGAGAVARLAYSGLSDNDKDMVASGNLDRLLSGIGFAQRA